MTFDAILAQVLDLFQRQGRVSSRALKRRFDLDDCPRPGALPRDGGDTAALPGPVWVVAVLSSA